MGTVFIPVKTSAGQIEQTDDLDYFLIERRFGKTTHFLLVDSDTGKFNVISNTNKHMGGTKHTPDIVKENDADVVISAHMGEGAYNGIKDLGIPILRGDLNVPISIIIEKYNSGVLEEFTTPKKHDGSHHH